MLGRAATALRCSFGAAPSEVVAAGGRGGGGSAAQSIGKGSNATLAARWLAAGSSVAYGRGRSGRSDITGMRRIITFGEARKKAGNLEMRVSWIAFGMKWAEIRSGTFCLEQGPELSRHDTLRDGGARNISLEPEPEPEPKPKKGKNVIRRRSGSRLKCNRLRIRFESNLVRISQCSIPPGQLTPPPWPTNPGYRGCLATLQACKK